MTPGTLARTRSRDKLDLSVLATSKALSAPGNRFQVVRGFGLVDTYGSKRHGEALARAP
jgi:hypothetical protein